MTALRGFWPEVQDTCTSLGLMLLLVLFMGLARVVTRQPLHRFMMAHTFVLEFLATFQLCCCTHELQLLSEQEPAHPTWPLTLIYFFSLVHGLTLVGTSSNPCGVMMQMLLGGMSPETGAIRLLAQLIGALCSRYCISALWSLGLTKYHLNERTFACRNPIQVDLPKAVITEAICSFIFHSALLHFQEIRTKLRIHLLAALITFLVYAAAIAVFQVVSSHVAGGCSIGQRWRLFAGAEPNRQLWITTVTEIGGSLTGAVFNPALALSLHFKCFDEAFLRFFIVYWLAPSLGILLMILMFSFFLPWLYNNHTINKKE